MNIWQKISAVMADVEYLKKDDVVGEGTKSSYKAISEEKVTEAMRATFIRHGLIMIPVEQVHTCETRDTLNDYGKAGVSRMSTVNVKYKLIDVDTGEFETIVSSGQGVDTQDKAVGKAMTYSYKYALLRSFAIPTGDDPDKIASAEIDAHQDLAPNKPVEQQKPPSQATAPKPTETTPQGKPDTNTAQTTPAVKPSDAQLKRLFAIMHGAGKEPDQLMAHMVEKYGIESTKELNRTQYDECCKWLEIKV